MEPVQEELFRDNYHTILVPQEHLEDFAEVIRRGLNTWQMPSSFLLALACELQEAVKK